MLKLPALVDEKAKASGPLLQPLTFGGVARFGRERLGRLLLAQCLFAFGAAACVVTALAVAWCPVIEKAIQELPDAGAILNGELQWPRGVEPVVEENRVFGLAVGPNDRGDYGLSADQQVVLGGTLVRVGGWLGYLEIPYPTDRFVKINRQALTPWWGAWKPAILAGVGVSTVIGLFVSWLALATLYWVPARIIASLAKREAGAWTLWKLTASALLPGSLVMDGAILLYVLSSFPLPGLGLAFALHLVTGWVYVAGAPLKLPRRIETPPEPKNPFGTPEPGGRKPDDADAKSKNPFAPGGDKKG